MDGCRGGGVAWGSIGSATEPALVCVVVAPWLGGAVVGDAGAVVVAGGPSSSPVSVKSKSAAENPGVLSVCGFRVEHGLRSNEVPLIVEAKASLFGIAARSGETRWCRDHVGGRHGASQRRCSTLSAATNDVRLMVVAAVVISASHAAAAIIIVVIVEERFR
jgi:hypothetical protein